MLVKLAVAAVMVASVTACTVQPSESAPSASAVRPTATVPPRLGDLPDLRMARLEDLALETTDAGRRLLRFTAIIVNVGEGPLEIWAERAGDGMGRGVQRIHDGAGSFQDLPTDATFFWAGDGHEHWHVRDMQAYRVESLDGSDPDAVSEKHGFCLFDNDRFDDPPAGAPVGAYRCPGSQDASRIEMGLSVGWQDVYPASLPNQYIDVSDLAAGRYRLWAEADPASAERPNGWFVESVEDNNLTWVDVELDTDTGTVEVLEYGPSATETR